eukprot:330005_1
MNKSVKNKTPRRSSRLTKHQRSSSCNPPKTPSNTKTNTNKIRTNSNRSSKRRRSAKSIGRKRKKTTNTYGKGGNGNITREENRKQIYEKRNVQRDRDRKRDKKLQETKNKKLQEHNDTILAMSLQVMEKEEQTAELVNDLITLNEKVIKQKEMLKNKLDICVEKSDKIWNKMKDIIYYDKDEEWDYVYVEETKINDDDDIYYEHNKMDIDSG